MKFNSIAAFSTLATMTFSLPSGMSENVANIADIAAEAIYPPQRILDDLFPATGPHAPVPILDALPLDIKLKVFEHRSMTFEEARHIASRNKVSDSWAIQHHNPSKDNYAIIREWQEMPDINAKNALKEKMMLNPNLKKLLDWTGSLDLTHGNLMRAVDEGNPDIVKYFVARGIRPNRFNLHNVIQQGGNLESVKVLIKEGKVVPNAGHLSAAILRDEPEMVQALITGGVRVDSVHLGHAIPRGNVQVLNALIRGGGEIVPVHLDMAIRRGDPQILHALIEGGGVTDSRHLYHAIRRGIPQIVNTLIQGGALIEVAHLYLARQRGNPEIINALTEMMHA